MNALSLSISSRCICVSSVSRKTSAVVTKTIDSFSSFFFTSSFRCPSHFLPDFYFGHFSSNHFPPHLLVSFRADIFSLYVTRISSFHFAQPNARFLRFACATIESRFPPPPFLFANREFRGRFTAASASRREWVGRYKDHGEIKIT